MRKPDYKEILARQGEAPVCRAGSGLESMTEIADG
jgi:hypothetical protein